MKITVYAGDDSGSDVVLQCTADIVQGLMLGYNRIPECFRHHLNWAGIQTQRLDYKYVRLVNITVKLSVETAKVPEPLLLLVLEFNRVKDSILKEEVARRFHEEVLHRLIGIGEELEHTATWFKNATQEKP